MGVVTQCLKSQKVAKANLQYWANVMLKYVPSTTERRLRAQKLFISRVNAKLGGVNNVLDNSFLNDPVNPTIVMGMFVIGINSYILSLTSSRCRRHASGSWCRRAPVLCESCEQCRPHDREVYPLQPCSKRTPGDNWGPGGHGQCLWCRFLCPISH